MCIYIEECLGQQYVVEIAKNGEEGFQKARTIVPDLIISDVMMPKMDGYQLAKALRSELSTSHIPIILLTAKASKQAQMEGLKTGADAYLSKPFNVEELHLRINKLIEIRQLIVSKYAPTAIKESFTKENEFITEVKVFIEEHLEERNLNGDYISKHFGLSRMQLHRKLRALVNQSTGELINDIRLEKGLALLQTRNYHISEIAYQVGFSTPDYFSRQFKKKYGKSPSKYEFD